MEFKGIKYIDTYGHGYNANVIYDDSIGFTISDEFGREICCGHGRLSTSGQADKVKADAIISDVNKYLKTNTIIDVRSINDILISHTGRAISKVDELHCAF